MTVGEFINKRRLALNITLDEIGEAVGVGKSTVKKWETGYISNMKRDKIDKLAKILQVEPSVFLQSEIDYDEAVNPSSAISPVEKMQDALFEKRKILFDLSAKASEEDIDKFIKMMNAIIDE